jgi:hypothetical protein
MDAATNSTKQYDGFYLIYTANNYDDTDTVKCSDGKARTVSIEAVCDKSLDNGVWKDMTGDYTCHMQLQYTGKEACNIIDIDIGKYFRGLNKFMGIIAIVLGLVLTFWGSKFILIVFGLLCFLATQVVMWSILYNTKLFDP